MIKNSSNYNDSINNAHTYHLFFRKLANPVKVRIINVLKDGDSSVNEICKKLKIEQSKISHALKTLKNCNIVKVNKKGKQRIYSLNKDTILPILKLIDKHREKFCKICTGK